MFSGTLLGVTEQKSQNLVLSPCSSDAFQTIEATPLHCSPPFSWRGNPYVQLLRLPLVSFLCLVHVPCVANCFKADRLERCSSALSDLLFLLSSPLLLHHLLSCPPALSDSPWPW